MVFCRSLRATQSYFSYDTLVLARHLMTDGANNIRRYRSSLAVPAFLLFSIGLLFLLNAFGADDYQWVVPFSSR